jgi:hypothetical protein
MRPPAEIFSALKPAHDLAPRVATLVNKIGGLYAEPRPVLKETELADIYWEALELLVKAKLPEPAFVLSGWNADERAFIDGGIAPAGREEYEERTAAIEGAEPFAEAPGGVQVHFLSSYLALKMRKIMDADDSASDAAKLEQTIAEHEIRLKEIRHKRMKFYDEAADPARLKAAAYEVDENLLEFAVKAAAGAEGAAGLAREALNASAEKLRSEEAAQFSEPTARRGLALIMNEIFKLSVEFPKLKLLLAASKTRMKSFGGVNERETALAVSRADALIAAIQKAVYGCAGPKGTPAFHGRAANTPASVEKEISAALEADHALAGLFTRGERAALTAVILPCRGHERVDKTANLIWLPLAESETGASSAVRAMAELSFTLSADLPATYAAAVKFTMDERSPELLEKYKNVYSAFIAEKSGGKRALSGNVREFFEKTLGAGKSDE